MSNAAVWAETSNVGSVASWLATGGAVVDAVGGMGDWTAVGDNGDGVVAIRAGDGTSVGADSTAGNELPAASKEG
ncbi:MAG: hypothetical protein MI924_09575 [Chloroflexales bacterium]|nr:hypothetical protein [Chloroflexales bacterium]